MRLTFERLSFGNVSGLGLPPIGVTVWFDAGAKAGGEEASDAGIEERTDRDEPEGTMGRGLEAVGGVALAGTSSFACCGAGVDVGDADPTGSNAPGVSDCVRRKL